MSNDEHQVPFESLSTQRKPETSKPSMKNRIGSTAHMPEETESKSTLCLTGSWRRKGHYGESSRGSTEKAEISSLQKTQKCEENERIDVWSLKP